MKKSDIDFSTPQRESPWALVFILGKSVYQIISRIWPALLVLFLNLNPKKGNPDYLLPVVISVAILAAVISLINYFRTYFFVADHELVITKGVFQKLRTNIPFNRIQSIHFQQNILHSIGKVVHLKIETAGSEKTEVDFYAIEKWKAEKLREIVLSGKSKVKSEQNVENSALHNDNHVVLNLSFSEVFLVGLTRNHLKSGGVILLFFLWLYDQLNEIGLDADNYFEDWIVPDFSIYWLVAICILFLVFSIAISLIRTILTYFQLTIKRVKGGFHLESGLFTKKELSARERKIQLLSWSDNLLKQQLGIFDLKMVQAGVNAATNQQKIIIPGAKIEMIRQMVIQIFGFQLPDSKEAKRVHISFFLRYAFGVFIASGALFTVFWILNYRIYAFTSFILFLGLILIRYLKFLKKRYQVDERSCVVWGGAFGEKNSIFPLNKIQGLAWHQSPFQRRKGLVTLRFYLASGSVEIPYIPLEDAKFMINLGLFISESAREEWM